MLTSASGALVKETNIKIMHLENGEKWNIQLYESRKVVLSNFFSEFRFCIYIKIFI